MARPRSILYEINPTSECWEWLGVKSWNGYGRVKRDGKLVWAHRWHYEEAHGKIPDGYDLDHLCRNIICVNPAHLEPVTKAENQRRGTSVRLTWEAVDYIRKNYRPYHAEFGTRALGRKYGVSHAAIQKVIHDRSWTDENWQDELSLAVSGR